MSKTGIPRSGQSAPASGMPLDQDGLVRLLVTSLEALASSGQVDAACRLAGQACAGLRHSDPRGWSRLNALLHRLARHAPPVGCNVSTKAV
ncbi:hypothetical protein [Hoeflea sp.]|uniref:hypothetical protein n=1 Tax=Hoeflea sp. TaxID=1940281 RepID=UPI003A90CD02